MLGTMFQYYVPVWIVFGIAAYGFAYFLVHDVYIHRRFKWLRDIDHPYFYAIRKAHKVHHKHTGKEHGECFGMLIVPPKFYKEAKKSYQSKYKPQ
jgi:beta-carotene 3-hydroxylase